MPIKLNTQLRHARFYEQRLREINQVYQNGGHNNVSDALVRLDLEWEQIQQAHAWSAINALQINEADWVCAIFPDAGSAILELRQHVTDRLAWFKAALSTRKAQTDVQAQAALQQTMGNAFADSGDFQAAFKSYDLTLQLCDQISYTSLRYVTLYSRSNLYLQQSRFTEALEDIQVVIRHIDLLDVPAPGSVYIQQGNIFLKLEKYGLAKDNYEKGINLIQQTGDIRAESIAYFGLGNFYFMIGDEEKATCYFEQSLQLSRQLGDEHSELSNMANIGTLNFESGQYQKSLQFLEPTLERARKINDPLLMVACLQNIGQIFLFTNQADRAIPLFEEAISLNFKMRNEREMGRVLEHLALALMETRQFLAAKNALERAYEIYLQLGESMKCQAVLENIRTVLALQKEEVRPEQVTRKLERPIRDFRVMFSKAAANSIEAKQHAKRRSANQKTRAIELAEEALSFYSRYGFVQEENEIKQFIDKVFQELSSE